MSTATEIQRVELELGRLFMIEGLDDTDPEFARLYEYLKQLYLKQLSNNRQ